ncbi:Lipase, GDSL [Corchorus capsularis]|uniref:Kinesin-like protein n=1 Tax=Corchorus capsularis TaxID=210143 RepID=A0A1R3GWN2_COCAP|nr:Lipase, GDSL [Corchorus capsularis]
MSNITVCARFRPLSSKEKRDHGANICIQSVDSESFIIKDEKDEGFTFSFDKVFYEKSKQADVYEFLVLPIVRDSLNAINGTIIAYGQTGAGKTYSMEGLNILESDEEKKGILPRVVDGLFACIRSSDESTKYSIKLSMVEIYMEKVRDLFDLSKDNIQIKESKTQGILLSGATEISLLDPSEALQSLSSGIANRAVGETQMNMASSRSHCLYMFTVHQESTIEKRVKFGKLVLVDLAGSEKVEKTGAEGRILEEAKTINKSLSALGNVINALTRGSLAKANHIPYRDSKLTRILQDSLGGSSRTALLCCCSPSPSNVSESLSSLRFGARAKHIKTSPFVKGDEEKSSKKSEAPSATRDHASYEKILEKMGERLNAEDVKLLEELFIQAGLFDDLNTTEDLESAFQDVVQQTISSLMQAVEELRFTVDKLERENKALKERLAVAEMFNALPDNGANSVTFNYPAVFNFGDSNSDTGELVAALGDFLDLPNGQTYFKTPSGRFCNGRLIVDFLMDAMDLPFLNAYLDSIGAPSFRKGCNFAAAGSTINPPTAQAVSPFPIGVQVAQFLRFKARVLELLAKGNKLNKYLPAEDYFQKALYMFDIGQNDLAGSFYSKTFDQVLAYIPAVLTEFENAIKTLYDQGARNFWIHNTAPLGCLAQNVAKFGTDPSSLDEQGCVSKHNQAAKVFNLQLHALVKKWQGQYTDSNFTYVDIYTIKSNLIANYSKLGKQNCHSLV